MPPSLPDLKRLRADELDAIRKRQDALPIEHWKQASIDVATLLDAIEAQRAEVLEDVIEYCDERAEANRRKARDAPDESEDRYKFLGLLTGYQMAADHARALKAAKE